MEQDKLVKGCAIARPTYRAWWGLHDLIIASPVDPYECLYTDSVCWSPVGIVYMYMYMSCAVMCYAVLCCALMFCDDGLMCSYSMIATPGVCRSIP